MRPCSALLLGACVAFGPLPAMADACAEKFAALLARAPFDGQAYEAQITVVSAGIKTVMVQKFLTDLHYLNTTVDPKGAPEILMFKGGTFTTDGNGGWKLMYQTDPAALSQQITATRSAQSAAVIDATCDTEDSNGGTFDRVSGRVAPVPPYDSEQRVSYLIDPSTGREVQTKMDYSTSGIALQTQFDFAAAPGLALPTP